MKLIIDTNEQSLTIDENQTEQTLPLYSKKAFEIISQQWLKVGWNQKHPYTFSWLGRPIIQIPEDILRIQEVIYRIKPDVIIETGIAHGGSLIFYASLCKAMDKGKVIGVDVEIRPHNRQAIEAHELFSYITLLEGSSIAKEIIQQVEESITPSETVLVILDSNHTKSHVLAELDAYHHLVSKDSYIVATDGSMQFLYDVPRGKSEWQQDNPLEAALIFVKTHPEFEIEQPAWLFNESDLTENITHWPSAYLKRIK
ncbi:MAG: CmcI family methyltransferase [Thiotrichaceae bacterium]|nr:CmcI family methyltransferase [Thiotrichaceae bacterium]